MRAPVIVTRPAAPGQRLAAALRRRGCEVAWWPAFDIAPPANEAAVRRALDHLADYDLALFVSPNAVHATAERLAADWPASTVIGAVGASTRDAAAAELPGSGAAAIVAPDDGDESGSEGFWRAWRATGRRARRVLLLRAATGRDWIIDQFRAADAEVDALAVYDRSPHALPEGERRPAARLAGPRRCADHDRQQRRGGRRDPGAGAAGSRAPPSGCNAAPPSPPIRAWRSGCRRPDSRTSRPARRTTRR